MTDDVSDDERESPVDERPGQWVDLTAGTTPSLAIVEAVADATDRDPTDLPPLAETADPDAIDAILTSTDPDAGLYLSFRYAGVTVAVEGQTVRVRE